MENQPIAAPTIAPDKIQFIKDNIMKMPRRQMAKEMGVSYGTLNYNMTLLRLTRSPFKAELTVKDMWDLCPITGLKFY